MLGSRLPATSVSTQASFHNLSKINAFRMDGKRKLRKIRLVHLIIKRQSVTKSLWKVLLHKLIVMKYRGVRTTFGDTFVTLSTMFESTTSNVKISNVL